MGERLGKDSSTSNSKNKTRKLISATHVADCTIKGSRKLFSRASTLIGMLKGYNGTDKFTRKIDKFKQ